MYQACVRQWGYSGGPRQTVSVSLWLGKEADVN